VSTIVAIGSVLLGNVFSKRQSPDVTLTDTHCITPETLRKKHAGPVSVRFKYTIKRSISRPALPSRSVAVPLRMKATFSASARALTYPTDFSRVRRVVAVDPASILRYGQFFTTVGGAVYAQRGIFSPPRYHTPTRVPFADVQARYGRKFHRAMRVPLGAFCHLVDVLRPRLSRLGVPPDGRTAIALRYLGGGSSIEIGAALGVYSATVYRALWDVIDAVNSSPTLDLDYQLENSTRRRSYASDFQGCRFFPFDNVCGALDGIAIDQEQPLSTDVSCVADYYSRKGFYALNTQAICDSDYKFRWMACTSPGSVHDSTAFSGTGLGPSLLYRGSALARSMTRDGHCIAADEAYAASELVAVPWPGGGPGDRWRDAYNFFLSSLRIHIEQAIGMLLWRWGFFWRPLRVPFSKRPGLIRACFRLHNFFRSFSSAAAAPVAAHANDRNGGSVSFARNDGVRSCQRARRRDCERSDLRVRMTSRVEARGILRPGVVWMF